MKEPPVGAVVSIKLVTVTWPPDGGFEIVTVAPEERASNGLAKVLLVGLSRDHKDLQSVEVGSRVVVTVVGGIEPLAEFAGAPPTLKAAMKLLLAV